MDNVAIGSHVFIKEEVILPVNSIKQEPEVFDNEAQETYTASCVIDVKIKSEEHDVVSEATSFSLSCIKQEPDKTETPGGLSFEMSISKDKPNDFENSLMHIQENTDINDLSTYPNLKNTTTENKDKFLYEAEEIEGKYFKCFHCDLAFINVNLLKKHLPYHFNAKKKIICMECCKTYKNVYDLIFHMDAHTNKFENVDAKIDSEALLNLRTKTQPLENVFWRSSKPVKKYNDKCFRCNDFNDLDRLKKHASDCKIDFSCQKCDTREFRCGCSLLLHMEWHKISRPFQCDKCDLKFPNLTLFRKHLRSHEESDSYNCKMCFEEFKLIDSLIFHYAYTHYSKSFECVYCGKSFNAENVLVKHRKTVHKFYDRKKENEAQKKQLKSLGIRKGATLSVISTKEKNNFKCDNCGKEFDKIEDLEMHEKSHVKRPMKTYSRKEV